jgi:glutamate synthase domain-containing protein 2
MCIIKSIEDKLTELIKPLVELGSKEGAGVKFTAHNFVYVPLSNLIIINRCKHNERLRSYGSFKNKEIQKLLELHKKYWMEKFKQDSKTPSIYNFSNSINERFYKLDAVCKN